MASCVPRSSLRTLLSQSFMTSKSDRLLGLDQFSAVFGMA